MLRIVQTTHTGNAKSYLRGEHEHHDKYTGTEFAKGVWRGSLAELLSLSGPIRDADWNALCDNRHPSTGTPLTGRDRADRTIAYDFNFNCPKSVSVMMFVGGDYRIGPVFRKAMYETMLDIQRDAETRVRREGASTNRVTGNLVWGEYIHHTARPVGGVGDPHLHGHSYAFNMTLDPAEERLKAAQFQNLKRYAGYYEALFHSRLAEGVRELGYDIRSKGKFWGIDGVPERLISEYSQRSKVIDQVAAARGIEDPQRKAELGAQIREDKSQAVSWEDTLANWRSRLQDGDAEKLRDCRHDRPGRVIGGDQPALDVARRAMARVFDKSAVVDERRLLAEAIRISWDHRRGEEFQAAFDSLGLLRQEVDGTVRVTTKAVLAEEERLVKLANDGRNWFKPVLESPVPEGKYNLTGDQLGMVNHVLRSRHSIVLVEGWSGTGKTEGLKAIEHEFRRAGFIGGVTNHITYLAPTSNASRGVMREAGFENATTVAQYLSDTQGMSIGRKAVEHLRRQMVVVDEAAMLGTSELLSVAERARSVGAQLVLLYDTAQHTSVSRGDIASTLTKHAGLRAVKMEDIKRQTGEYKEAVESFARGETEQGFSRLQKMDAVKEVKREELVQAAAKDYVDFTKTKGAKSAVIAPTRELANEVSAAVREMLKGERKLGRDREFVQYRAVESTAEDRAQPDWYRKGQVVQLHQNCRSLKAGTKLRVVGNVGGVVVGLSPRTGLLPLAVPLSRPDSFQVYEEGTIKLAVGEHIRITKPARVYSKWELVAHQFMDRKPAPTHDLNTGAIHRIKRFSRGNIVLENNLVIPKDFGHFEHGYGRTSVTCQGSTFGRAIVLQPSDAPTSFEQFHTSISRGRDSVAVYTDNAAWLQGAVQRSSREMVAMDLMKLRELRVKESIEQNRQREEQRREQARQQEQHRKQEGFDRVKS